MKRVGIICCFFVLLAQPVSASAQTTEVSYRAQLLELITVLQQQIAALEAELQARQSANIIDGNYTTQVRVMAEYTKSADGTWSIASQTHRAYLQTLLATWPAVYASQLKRFVIFDASRASFDAYVETASYDSGIWTYGVGDELVTSPQSDANLELMTHELAHVFARDTVSRSLTSSQSCVDYVLQTDCLSAQSYFGQYVARFWSAGQLADAVRIGRASDIETTAYRYYQANPGEFVSDYAAHSPEEDFAESFMYYSRGFSPDCRDCVAVAKVAFFDRFPSLRVLR